MNGKILKNTTSTVTQTATIEEINGNKYFNFGEGKYFDIGTSIRGDSSRTFIVQATLLEGIDKVQFIDAGYDSGGCLFSLGWGWNTNQLFYHFSYDDDMNLHQLTSPGSYMLAFVYNANNDGGNLTIYVNGEQIHSSEHYLSTGGSGYRIGNRAGETGNGDGNWKSKFGIVYNRALSADEIKYFNKFGI